MKNIKNLNKKALGLLISFLLIMVIVWAVYPQNPINDSAYYPGTQTETGSYLASREGSIYYIKNGSTGAIDYSGSNASDVVQSVFNLGGRVYFGEYIFTFTHIVSTLAPTEIIGAGWNKTIFRLDNNADCKILEFNASTTIRDLSLDGNGGNQGVSNVVILRVYADDCLIDHVEFYDSANSGLAVDGAERVTVQYSYSHHNSAEGFGVVCLAGEPSNDIKFLSNYVAYVGTEGILLSNAGDQGISNVLLNGNTIFYANNKGIQVSHGCTNIIITNNHVAHCQYGIVAISSASESPSALHTFNITVSQNQVYDMTSNIMISINRVNYFTVSDNIIWTSLNNSVGVRLGGSSYGVVDGNIIQNLPAVSYGIQLQDSETHNSTHNIISSNICSLTYRGIWESGNSDFNIVIGCNTYNVGAGYGIQLVGANSKCVASWNKTAWVS